MSTKETISDRSMYPAARLTKAQQSRRDFLKSTALFAGTAAAPALWSGTVARAAASPNGKLNVAAIGVGGQGSGIGHAAGQLGNMVACCDVDRERAEKFAAKYEGRAPPMATTGSYSSARILMW